MTENDGEENDGEGNDGEEGMTAGWWRGLAMASVCLALLGGAGCETASLEDGANRRAALSGSVSVAVVDMQWLLSESKMGQQVTENLNQFMKNRQELLALEQEELRSLEGELVRLGGVLSPSARQQKEEQLRQRMAGYQQKAEDMNREVQTKRGDLLGEFRAHVDGVVQRIAQRDGVILVVEKGQNTSTRYADAGLDLSAEVLEDLDRMFAQ